MSRVNFNRSSVPLILAILLLASGSVFLVENLTDAAAWSIVLPWWPILLLVMGAWAVARGLANQLREERAGAWLWIGETFFALAIVGAGLAANFLTTSNWDLGFLEPPLVSTTKTVVRTVDFPVSRLVADNPTGRIKVIAWDRPQTRVTLKMTAAGATMRSARRRLTKEARPIIKRSGDGLRIVVKKPKLQVNAEEIPELTVLVPKATALRLRAFGRVSVVDARASIDVVSRVGRIRIERVAGPVKVRGELGDITISDVGGEVNVRSDQGNISLTDIRGPVTAANGGGSISVARAKADIRADNLDGGVEIVDPGGVVKIVANGHIIISAHRAPAGDWRARSEYGPIEVRLSRQAGFNLDAISEFGPIETSFFSRQIPRPDGGDKIQRQINGGGPLVHLRAKSGNIDINAID